VFAHADYGNDTHHVAKRPQSEWPKAYTVGGPVVQVGNNPIFFVLIDNPISQSEDVFFLSLHSAIMIYQDLLHAETFRLQIVYWLSPQGESAKSLRVSDVRDVDNVPRVDAPRGRSGCYEAGSGRCLSSFRREGGVEQGG